MKKRMLWVLSFVMASNLMFSTVHAEEVLLEDTVDYETVADSIEESVESTSETELLIPTYEAEEVLDDTAEDIVLDNDVVLDEDTIQEDSSEEQVLEGDIAETIEAEEDLSEVLAALMMTADEMEEPASSGTCGENAKWNIDIEEGITYLVIYGSGAMQNYSLTNLPEWSDYNIDYVVIQDGITSIGDYAFYGIETLFLVTVSDDVVHIGDYAFAECHELWNTGITSNVQTIGESAFENCDISLDPVCSEATTSIGARAFSGNSYMDSITIKGDTTTIGANAFDGCADGFTIYCNPGSTAETYAINNGINYSATRIDISTCQITLAKTSFVYDGIAKRPVVTVMDGDNTLIENEDYTLEYINNIDAGTASVIIEGIRGYTGLEFKVYTIKKATPTITASGKTFTLSTTENQKYAIGAKVDSKGKLTYSSDNAKVTVSSTGTVVIPKNFSGTANITIKAAATANYNAASKTIKIVVNKKTNTITASGTKMMGNYQYEKYYSINAKALGGAKITYSSDNKNITVDSTGKVTVKKNYTGVATITIKAAATSVYKAAEKKITITVVRRDNTITASNKTISASPSKAQTFSLGAKALGGAKLTYSSNNANVTVDSTGKVTVKKGYAGTATITITSSQTNVYLKQVKKITVTVNKISNTITASNKSLYVNVSSTSKVSIGATVKGGATLSYSSSDSRVTVSSTGVVTVARGYVGTATITIKSTSTSLYKAASKKITVTVSKRENTITASGYTFTASETMKQSHYLSAYAKGGARLYYSTNNGNVYVNNGTVIVNNGFSGKAVITIYAAETAEYKSARKQITITVNKRSQVITVKPNSVRITASNTAASAVQFEIVPLQYKGSISLQNLSTTYLQLYKYNGKHIVTVKKGTPAGTYYIRVTASGDNVYDSATKLVSVTVY